MGQESGDVLLFMTKENQNIQKCVLDLNMVMPHIVEAIQAQCKANKQMNKNANLPQIKKEIKNLRRQRGKSGDFPIDKLKRQITTQKTIIEENMDKINAVETNMEQERACAGEEMDELERQSKELAEKLEKLERDLIKQE